MIDISNLKSYRLNFFGGLAFIVIMGVALAIKFNTKPIDWISIIIFIALILGGIYLMNQGEKEWDKEEKLDNEYKTLRNKKIKLEIDNLEDKQIKRLK